MTYSSEVLADSPLGYWRLGDPAASGTSLTATASSNNGTQNAAAALDNNPDTYWTTNATTTGWWQVQFPAATVLTKYAILRRDDLPTINPNSWTFQGSNDGSTWTVLDTQSGITWPNPGEIKAFAFANSTAFTYYRINITANNGHGSHLSFAEFYTNADYIAADSSGNTRSGAYFGTPTRGATGLLTGDTDTATTFSGAAPQCVRVAYASWMVVSAVTVEALIQTTGTGVMPILDRDDGVNRAFQFRLNAGKLEFITIGGGAGVVTATSPGTVNNGVKHHVAATYDASNIRLYVDGTLVLTQAAVGVLSTSPSALAIGKNLANSAYFGGTIDEAAYYGTALSGARIAAHASAATTAGTTYSPPADPIGVTDSAIVQRSTSALVSDTVGASDAASAGAATVLAASPVDSVGILDSATSVVGMGAGLADPVTVTDSASSNLVLGAITAAVDDAVGATDSAAAVLVSGSAGTSYALTVEDAVGITDSVTVTSGSAQLYLPGSLWQPYPVSDSGSKALDFSIIPTDPESPFPYVWEGDGYSNSLWLVFTASASQTLSLSLPTGFVSGIEVWTGVPDDNGDGISLLGYGQGTLEVPITAGQRILMRAHPLLEAETGTGTFSWSTVTRSDSGSAQLIVQETLLETPGWLDVSLISAPPTTDVALSLDSGPVFYTVQTEDNGTFGGSVELPMLTTGTHTITAVTAGQSQTQSFAVLLEPLAADLIPGNMGPTTGVSAASVIAWLLEDPRPGGLGVYEFPINPSEMSSPWPVKNIRVEHTIHGSGQDVLWEGRAEPVVWTVKGVVQTQAFYQALEAFQSLNTRLYVIDHHQRAWIVAFDGLTFEKKGSPGELWFHGYTAKFTILGGPVALT